MNYKEEVININNKKGKLVIKARKSTIEEKNKLLIKYNNLENQKKAILERLEYCKELVWFAYNEKIFKKKFKEKFIKTNIVKALNTRKYLIENIKF